MKYVTNFLKQMIFPVIYMIIMAMTSLAISCIDNNLTWLKYLLNSLALALYAVILGAMAYKDGQEAMKIRHMNDLERVNIIRTGEDRPLNLVKEYKPWKGFMPGLSACVPLVILLLVHTILVLINPTTIGAGVLAGYLYLIVFSFLKPDLTVTIVWAECYFTLLAIPLFMLFTGLPYIWGAKKQELQYKMVEKKHKQIYGDEN